MSDTKVTHVLTALALAGAVLFMSAAMAWASPTPAVIFTTGTDKNILAEFFTGTWCSACPWGAIDLKELQKKMGNLVVISYHSNDPMSSTEGTSYINLVKVTVYPSAIFDRTVFPGHYTLSLLREEWNANIPAAASAPAGFNITAACGFSESDRTVTLDIEALALRDLTKKYRMNVIVTEDSLNYRQLMSPSETPEVYPYYHLNVFRKTLTGTTGEPFIDASVTKGTKLKKSYSFTLDSAISVKNASIMVFIHENQVNNIGVVEQALRIPMKVLLIPTSVGEENDVPNAFRLFPNRPNPFNPATTIDYSVERAGPVEITVFNALGQPVRTLTDGLCMPGRHSVVWDGRDQAEKAVSGGIYFCRMKCGAQVVCGKMLFLK